MNIYYLANFRKLLFYPVRHSPNTQIAAVIAHNARAVGGSLFLKPCLLINDIILTVVRLDLLCSRYKLHYIEIDLYRAVSN